VTDKARRAPVLGAPVDRELTLRPAVESDVAAMVAQAGDGLDEPVLAPDAPELRIAVERHSAASRAYLEASSEMRQRCDELSTASDELVRVWALAGTLREHVLHIVYDVSGGKRTASAFARSSHRNVVTVQAGLDRLVAEGLIRWDGRGYVGTDAGRRVRRAGG
jgi:hypothetical protein